MSVEGLMTLRVGDAAPAFEAAMVTKDGVVRLADYVGRAPLFLNLFRGLHCPFCRRAMAHLNAADRQLRDVGVETLVVIMTPRERAQTYFRYRPTRLEVASDPQIATFRSYGVPQIMVTEDEDDWPKVSMKAMQTKIPDPTGEIDAPGTLFEIAEALNKKDGYVETAEEIAAVDSLPPPLDSHFMIDRGGVVRWIAIEAQDGPEGFGKVPNLDAVLAAGRALNS
ncbi:MAG TPA: redoxin domain-containing protein [Kiloniellales bacterium]